MTILCENNYKPFAAAAIGYAMCSINAILFFVAIDAIGNSFG